VTDDERFSLPDGYADGTEKALEVLLRHGETEAAQIFIAERRDTHPAYGEHLATKYAKELGQ
jgi:hypothetical protein